MALTIIRERKIVIENYFDLCFNWPGHKDWGYAFACDEQGNVDEARLNPAAAENLKRCRSGTVDGKPIGPAHIRPGRHQHVEPAVARCDACGGEATTHPSCGAWVCHGCDNHLGLARCFCGWAASGGNGRAELEEYDEVMEGDY